MTETRSVVRKMAQLQKLLHDFQRIVIAFSGGVDSTFLLRVALDTLRKEDVLAVIGDSESYPSRELAEAQQLAADMGANYQVISTDELHNPQYAANPSNRCYYCKSELFTRIKRIAEERLFTTVLDGNNADDISDWRPGQQAARDHGVRSPLLEVGMTKAEIRTLSRSLGLPTWDKPAMACLSSRIPYNTPITREVLSAIESAESSLHALGFTQVRARHHGNLVRIEILPDEIARFTDPDLRVTILERLHAAGYQYITLDLQGYRTGSMNELVQE